MKIILNGNYIDILDGESIPITFQVSDPEKIESFQSNFSVNFKIPLTDFNKKVFGFIDESSVISDFPYTFQNVILIQNCFEVLPNCVLFINSLIQDYEYNFLECQLVQGYFNFFDVIGGKSIKDLDMSSYDHDFDIDTIVLSQINTSGYIYDVYERGIQNGLFDIWFGFMSPSIFVKNIWDQIFIDSGFIFEFASGEPDNWDDLLLPFSNKIRGIQAQDEKFAKKSSGTIQITTPYSVPTIGLLGVVVIGFDSSSFPKYNTENFGNGTVNIGGQFFSNPGPEINTYRVFNLVSKVFARVSINLHFTNATNVGSPNAIVSVMRGATSIYSENAPNGSGIDYDFKFNGVIELDALEELKITFTVATNGSLGIDRGSFEVEVIDHEALSSGVWEVAPNLPNISQSDFIKSFCLLRGLTPYFEPYERKIIFYEYNSVNLESNTKLFDLPINLAQEKKTEYKIDGVAQNNFLYYNGKELKGNFQVVNQLIPINRDIYEFPFRLGPDKFDLFNSLTINTYELKNLDEVLEFGPAISEYDNDEADAIICLKNIPISGDQTLKLYQNYDLSDTPENILIHRSQNGLGIDLQNCIDTYHKTFFSIAERTQKITFFAVITEKFLNENILFNPFFIDDLKCHYFIYKIEQWESEKPCKIYAYKLNLLE